MRKEYLHFDNLYTDHELPIDQLGEEALDSKVAYDLIKNELELETNEKQNLATFCQTYMEDAARLLINENLSKNSIDKTEYPKVTEIERRCIKIIEKLWNGQDTIGTSTIGSSEGSMLGGLSMKKRWQKANPNLNKPNLIISSGYQVCWEKFSSYFDVELKIVPISDECMTLDSKQVIEMIDENTIGVVGILGVTYTGLYDNIEELDKELCKYNENAKFPVYIHVDAASGGMYAPFVKPQIKWDFSLENVVSINTSGHKYGLTYPGVGWVLFKNRSFVSDDILFEVSYLGGSVPTMGINFSHSASHLIAQYYNFARFGVEGYEKIHQKTQDVAKYLYNQLEEIGIFTFINKADELPILCYSLKEDRGWNLYALSDELRKYSWQIPSYELSSNLEDRIVQRIVIRADFTYEFANNLVLDMKRAISLLEKDVEDIKKIRKSTFKH